MRRYLPIAAIVLGVVASAAWLVRPAPQPPVIAASPAFDITGRARADEAFKKLHQILPHVQFAALPLDQAIDQLSAASGANIFVDWPVLEDDQWDRQTPVTLELRNVSLARILTCLLQQVHIPGIVPGFGIVDGIIVIGEERSVAQQSRVTRVYDVRDLIESNIAWRNQLGKVAGNSYGYQEALDDFTKTITEVVATETWKENGGMIGSLYLLDGHLVVSQSLDAHLELVRLLQELRNPGRIRRLEPSTRPSSDDSSSVAGDSIGRAA